MDDSLAPLPPPPDREGRPGHRPRLAWPDAVFHAGCFALALLPAALAGTLLHDIIGEPPLFLAAVVLTVWVVTIVALVKVAGPMRPCRAIVAAGGLVSIAMCSLFLID